MRARSKAQGAWCQSLLALVLMVCGAFGQTASDLGEGLRAELTTTAGVTAIKWWGKAGRTYFVQSSETLLPGSWQYMPVVEAGNEAVCTWNLQTSASKMFVRLVYTDQVYSGSAGAADFDGDGLSNTQELVMTGPRTNPFSADTDDDGFSDSVEWGGGFSPTSGTSNPELSLPNGGMWLEMAVAETWDRVLWMKREPEGGQVQYSTVVDYGPAGHYNQTEWSETVATTPSPHGLSDPESLTYGEWFTHDMISGNGFFDQPLYTFSVQRDLSVVPGAGSPYFGGRRTRAQHARLRLRTNYPRTKAVTRLALVQPYKWDAEYGPSGSGQWSGTYVGTEALQYYALQLLPGTTTGPAVTAQLQVENGVARTATVAPQLVPVKIEIMHPDVNTDSEWQNNQNVWGSSFNSFRAYNSQNDSLKVRLSFGTAIEEDGKVGIEFEGASYAQQRRASAQWQKFRVKVSDQLSPDKTQIWCVIPASEYQTMIRPDSEDNPELEVFSFDWATTGDFSDSNAFDSKAQNLTLVPARAELSSVGGLIGNWTESDRNGPAGLVRPWTTRCSKNLLKHGGANYLEVRVGDAGGRAIVLDQADWLYYSGHGHSEDGTLEPENAARLGPTEVLWAEDLDLVIIAGCSVLDINDLNGNYDDDDADGDNNRTTGVEVGPASKVFPGEQWAVTGPTYFLGYNYKAPNDQQEAGATFVQASANIVKDWYNQSGGDKIDAWKEANNNTYGRNACAIYAGPTLKFYFYYHRKSYGIFTSYEWKSVTEYDW